MIAEFFQLSHIILGNGVQIHIAVHSRSHQNRRCRCHDCRRQHIVGNAIGDLTDDIGRRRCNDQDVGPAGQGNVFDVEFRNIFKHGNGNGIS